MHKSSGIFGANTVLNPHDPKLTYPLPLVQFDISDYIIQPNSAVSVSGKESPPTKRKVKDSPVLKTGILQTPLILKNTLNVPLKLKGIVNTNPELKVILANNNHYMSGIVLQPG